ncbi:MAG: hypothetical protein CNIPEHKO_02215 [Anaerolineales bacterium]|nr:hypothetical protein [Anaerolineales bacterium]
MPKQQLHFNNFALIPIFPLDVVEGAGLGIYHYQSRFYSPKLGRFLSADSLVPNPFNPQDYNRYSYVRNNPVRYTDPSGHRACITQEECADMGITPGGNPSKPRPQLCTRNCGGGVEDGGNPYIPRTTVTPSPTTTPTIVPTVTPTISTPVCTSPTNDCATNIAASQVTPTLTITPTKPLEICGYYNQPCSLTTVTPFARDIVVPAVERGVGLANPFTPSYDPFDAQQFWDTLLRGVPPIFGLPASSFEGVVNNFGAKVGNVASKLASAVSTDFGFGMSPTLPIFIIPADNFLFPISSPPEEYY